MSPEQLEIPFFKNSFRPTVSEGFDLLWKFHLGGKPSGFQFMSNRKAVCKSMGHKYMDQLNEVDVIRHKENRAKMGVGIGTIGHDHTVITLLFSKFYAWKRKRLIIDGIKFSDISLPDIHPTNGIGKKKAPPRNVIITPNEYSRLIEHATERLKRVLYYAIDTGIRRGDLMKLKLGDYNFQTGQLEFVQNKTGKWASIPVSNRVKQAILDVVKEGGEYLLDFTNFDFEWRLAKHNAGLRHKQFRDLRRSCATNAYNLCKDPRKVRDLVGHASERTTMDVYVVTQKQDLKPIVKHLEKTFS